MHIYNSTKFIDKNNTSEFSKGINGLWYISFEDAFWDLLENKHIKKGSLVLVPSFYCVDVMNNIEAHGYSVVTYTVNHNLRVDTADLLRKINELKPVVVFALHIQGIQSELINDKSIRNEILSKAILIEDAVHKLESPQEIKLYSNNHYVITSLRKVTPFTGSWIIGNKSEITWQPEIKPIPYLYAITTLFLHNIFQCLLYFGYHFNFPRIIGIAEWVLYWHNELIGDSKHAGSFSTQYKEKFFKVDFHSIYQSKTEQYTIYQQNIKENEYINLCKVPINETKYLRGASLIVDDTISSGFLFYLHKNNILTKYQLDDCDWSNDRKLLLLPLGPYISNNQIIELCEVINAFKY